MKLNVCSHGNPVDYKTWSGTPANICFHLDKINKTGEKLNFSLSSYYRKVLHLYSRAYYRQKVELHRSPLVKYARSLYIVLNQPLVKKSNCLHFSNMALPLLFNIKSQNHFLITDSTWHLWSEHSNFKDNYSARFIKDVERLEFKTYKQLKHIFSLSQYVKEDLIEHYNVPESKITVVGTGTGIIEPYHGPKDYSNHEILFVANKRYEDKGGPILVEAFKIASKIKPELKLNIVGIEESKIGLKDQHKNIKVHGFVEISKLQDLFNQCSLFAMPALNEPWGLVFIESLLCRCPILGYKMNAFPELSGQGEFGFILDEYNPQAMADLLIQAFSNPEKLKTMGGLGQEYAMENFTWKRTTTKIIDVIQNYE